MTTLPPPVERATAADFLSVAALDRIAWPSMPETFIPDGEHAWRLWCEHAVVLISRVAETELLPQTDEIAGALLMFPTEAGEQFLHKIMVHPKCRGRGIGSSLMAEALKRATTPVLLTVDPANAAAIKLYENFGFIVRDRIHGYYRPHEHRFVMMYDPRTGWR